MKNIVVLVLATAYLLSGACKAYSQNYEYSQSTYEPYYFGTLAGNAAQGSADGDITVAQFFGPYGVTLDSAGNIYVSDSYNHTIRKISPDGLVSTLAGRAGVIGSANGIGSGARFYFPTGVAVDAGGNVYVGDENNHVIRKITPGGVVSTYAGIVGSPGVANGPASSAQFNQPHGIVIDQTGNMYVADSGNHTIRKLDSNGVVSTFSGTPHSSGSGDGGWNVARFNYPTAIAFGSEGSLYVADTVNFTVRKVTATGSVTTIAGLAGNSGSADGTGNAARFSYTQAVAVDNAENVYVADRDNHTIRKITPNAVVTTFAGKAGSSGSADGNGGVARFNQPIGLTIDAAGNLYVGDYSNNSIRKISSTAVVSTAAGFATSAGTADGTGALARFNRPTGIAISSSGNLYVADYNSHTIRKVTSSGAVTTLAGLALNSGTQDGIGSGARFNHPRKLAVDSAENVYVADSSNHTIRKITSAGVVTTVAGLAGNSGNVDGTGSAARFNFPEGIAFDNFGNFYVADSFNHTIRKVTPDGMVSTLAGLGGNPGSADGTGSAARFNYPSGVTVDNNGGVYVADDESHTIRFVSHDGIVRTVAGFAGKYGNKDAGGSGARFFYPGGIALDSAQFVYVADSGNDEIRKIAPSSAVSTLAGVNLQSGTYDGTGDIARFTIRMT